MDAEPRTVRTLEEAASGPASELILVRGADVQRWARQIDELRSAVAAEREACAKIAEDHLNRLYHGHGATGERAILEIIQAIRARSEEG